MFKYYLRTLNKCTLLTTVYSKNCYKINKKGHKYILFNMVQNTSILLHENVNSKQMEVKIVKSSIVNDNWETTWSVIILTFLEPLSFRWLQLNKLRYEFVNFQPVIFLFYNFQDTYCIKYCYFLTWWPIKGN